MLVAVLLCAAASRAQNAPTEYQVKAAFLFNFGKFIEWPTSSFASPDASFQVCVVGEDPFGSALDDLMRGKRIAHHAVGVERIKNLASARRCQLLFVSATEKRQLPAILGAVRGSPVLLVGDADGFAASGGAIQFLMEQNHVRFAINPDAVRRAGLQISSRLLALATIVRDAGGGKS